MLKKYIEKLTDVGLTEKESQVYIALLDEGFATADRVSKLTDLNRSTVYVQIGLLTDLGLVSMFKKGKKTFYAAESPYNLERLLDRQVAELENKKTHIDAFLPDLIKVYTTSGTRPVIRTFEGKEGLTSMRNEILASGEKKIYAAFSFDDLYRIYSKDELMQYSNQRAKNKIKSYVIYNKTGDDAVVVPPQELRRVSAEHMPIASDLYIYGDTVSIASTSDSIVGITISNVNIAQTMKTVFELAWRSS